MITAILIIALIGVIAYYVSIYEEYLFDKESSEDVPSKEDYRRFWHKRDRSSR